jgi:preprotein translocase subunit Sec61beta
MSMMVVDPRMATMDTSSFVVGAGLLQFFDCSRLGLRVTQQAAFCELRPEVGFVIN